jgi:hypothetical protein
VSDCCVPVGLWDMLVALSRCVCAACEEADLLLYIFLDSLGACIAILWRLKAKALGIVCLWAVRSGVNIVVGPSSWSLPTNPSMMHGSILTAMFMSLCTVAAPLLLTLCFMHAHVGHRSQLTHLTLAAWHAHLHAGWRHACSGRHRCCWRTWKTTCCCWARPTGPKSCSQQRSTP